MHFKHDREAREMKGVIVLMIVLLAGCAGYKPLAQLEAEALVSGDWSLVEQRERIIARREARSGPTCPDGKISYCSNYMASQECQCVKRSVLNSLLDTR
jgi:hypothetical protein